MEYYENAPLEEFLTKFLEIIFWKNLLKVFARIFSYNYCYNCLRNPRTIFQNNSGRVFWRFSGGFSKEIHGGITKQIYERFSVRMFREISEKISRWISLRMSGEICNEALEKISESISKNIAEKNHRLIFRRTPGETSEGLELIFE